jgi:hypothetical protein
MLSSKELEDLIAELEETVIILQSQVGQHNAVEQIQRQIEALKKRAE